MIGQVAMPLPLEREGEGIFVVWASIMVRGLCLSPKFIQRGRMFIFWLSKNILVHCNHVEFSACNYLEIITYLITKTV